MSRDTSRDIHSRQVAARASSAAAQHVLEPVVLAVEDGLSSLGMALQRQDALSVDRAAAELHLALSLAVDHFARAAQTGPVPSVLRQRLALAGGQVAAQREALARATASLDRAIDVLMPRLAPSRLYTAGGVQRRAGPGAGLLA